MYGDGFELKGNMYICGDAESVAEAEKYNQIRAQFQSERLKLDVKSYLYATQALEKPSSPEEIMDALNATVNWGGLTQSLDGGGDEASLAELLLKAWQSQKEAEDGERLESLMQKIDDQQTAVREDIERRVQKRRESELFGRAEAESARLRAILMPDSLPGGAAEALSEI